MQPRAYTDLDRGPPPEAHERNSDSAWARFEALSSGAGFDATEPTPLSTPDREGDGDRAFAPTQPTESATPDGVPGAPVAKRVTVTDAMDEARRNRRICPGQAAWLQLYEMLPGKRQVGPSWQPAPPVAAQAWDITPSISKRMCLRDQLEWADKYGCLDDVLAFLKSLPEDAWHHSE